MSLGEWCHWYQGFCARFEKEIKLLLKVESFWKVCHECPDGYCCGRYTLPLMIDNVNPFKTEEWWLILNYVKQNFSAQQRQTLLRNINIADKRKECIFLFGCRCSVHPARPWACRLYPYTISFRSSPVFFLVGGLALPSCPALAPAFGLKPGNSLIQNPDVLLRHSSGKLVKCKLKKRKPLWLIDASDYFQEYEASVSQCQETKTYDWAGLFELANEVWGKEGQLVFNYLRSSWG
jgi:Fe-S-cluster containining protein